MKDDAAWIKKKINGMEREGKERREMRDVRREGREERLMNRTNESNILGYLNFNTS